MPELPEVEAVVNALGGIVRGKRITGVRVLRPQTIQSMSVTRFCRLLRGRVIERVRRRAKFILLDLSDGWTLVVHLRMTGGFVYAESRRPFPPTARVLFLLEGGARLAYTDIRNLGLIRLVRTERLDRWAEWRRLGVEPLSRTFTVRRLEEMLRGSRRAIKAFLLDQTKVVGLGNIYAAEALHRARLSPMRRAESVARSKARLVALYESIRETLREAIAAQSTGPLHLEFVNAQGQSHHPRRAPSPFRVYGREGEPCPVCGAPIRRIKQHGRSTYYCARCQT